MSNRKVISSIESNTRSISVVGDYIIYQLKIDGIADYLSYDETLYEILKLNKVLPFRDDGRLRFDVWKNNTRIKFYMYDLAFACYHGLIRVENFIEDLQAYYDNK